jgi:uncharacterized protein YecA (UPF0149 family)
MSGARVQTVHNDINMLAGGEQPHVETEEAPRRQLSAEVPQSAVAGFDAMLQAMGKAERAPSPRSNGSADGGDLRNVGRNDPCPCGSGKKYKKCCGQGL